MPTPAAAASAYRGTAQATHFCVSRSRPAPGTCTIAHSPACSPGPVAARAGPSTATAASAVSTPSTGLRRRRHSAGTPHATTSSSAAVPTSAHTVARDAGTASAFQMPPSPATLPSVPSAGSARAAKARTPAGSDPSPAPPDTAVATSHGAATAPASATAPA
ncbi:hypothetical protein G352_25152, partial [Rhodococcus ruber BKS 20-38]